jgi:hypothetical protein
LIMIMTKASTMLQTLKISNKASLKKSISSLQDVNTKYNLMTSMLEEDVTVPES